MQHSPLAIFAHQVAVAVAREAARSGTERHEACCGAAFTRPLLLTDVGLVVWQAEVLRPELRRDLHGLASAERRVDHVLVHALGMHIDLDLTAARSHAFEHLLPEL